MPVTSPHVILLAGPNGAGKTTAAPILLGELYTLETFVNADVIAAGLSGFSPDTAALEAGAIMLTRVRRLAEERLSFAFETTLGSRTFAPWIRELVASGYVFRLIFLWLPSPDAAVERVKRRVILGGHAVPEETIRRRYERGIINFFELYQPLASIWTVYDNTVPKAPRPIAQGGHGLADTVFDPRPWQGMMDIYAGKRSR